MQKLSEAIGASWPSFVEAALAGDVNPDELGKAYESGGVEAASDLVVAAYVRKHGDIEALRFGPSYCRGVPDSELLSRLESDELLTEWAGHSVLFQGASGMGKTTAAVLMARDYIRKRWVSEFSSQERKAALLAHGTHVTIANVQKFWPAFVSAFELVEAVEGHKLGDGLCPAVAEARSAPVIVIDDLGDEPKHRASVIGNMLRYAAQESIPVIVTTWMNEEQRCERYGGGVTRRATGADGKGLVVPV